MLSKGRPIYWRGRREVWLRVKKRECVGGEGDFGGGEEEKFSSGGVGELSGERKEKFYDGEEVELDGREEG